MRRVEEMMQTENTDSASGMTLGLPAGHWEQLLTVAEAAREVGCHEESLRRAYRAGFLSAVHFGSRNRRIRRSDLRAWQDAGMKVRH
jgi:excisionase family DNA binding protein